MTFIENFTSYTIIKTNLGKVERYSFNWLVFLEVYFKLNKNRNKTLLLKLSFNIKSHI